MLAIKTNIITDDKKFMKMHIIIPFFVVFACRFSLVVVSGGYSSLRYTGSSLWWLLLLWSTDCRAHSLQQLWHTGSVSMAHRL